MSLLKQITSPAEDVIQQCCHWLELISKYEASVSGEKVSDTIKITLALQNVRGNLAQSLNVSVSETATWSQAHTLLFNYFNNAAPVETKGIYISSIIRTSKRRSTLSRRGKAKVSNQKEETQPQKGKSKGKGKTKSKGKGQWTTWSWDHNQNWNQEPKRSERSLRQIWKRQGLFYCQVCGKSGRQARQCWWNTQQQGAQNQQQSQNSRHVDNISEFPQDQPSQTFQPDQLRGFQDLRPAAQPQPSVQSQVSSHYGLEVFCSSSLWTGRWTQRS